MSLDLLLRINLKVEVVNVFQMLEHAYQLRSFLIVKSPAEADKLQ